MENTAYNAEDKGGDEECDDEAGNLSGTEGKMTTLGFCNLEHGLHGFGESSP